MHRTWLSCKRRSVHESDSHLVPEDESQDGNAGGNTGALTGAGLETIDELNTRMGH